MRVQNNRIFSSFGITGRDGQVHPVLTQIDTGGGALVVARKMVDALGLKVATAQSGRSPFVPLDVKEIFAGSLRIPVTRAATTIADRAVFNPGAASPGFVAAAYFHDHAVTFDYLNGELIFDGPPIDGVAESVMIGASAMPRIEITIDGERMGLLLDTGASFTMLSRAVIDKLRAKYPSWKYAEGAYGPANMLGGKFEVNSCMLRIPEVRWGSIIFGNLDVVSREVGTFEKFMSGMLPAPVVGALGGNALRNFIIRIDYPKAKLDVRYSPRPWADELTLVPLILQPQPNGKFSISGGVSGLPLTGKRLDAIDGQSIRGLSLGAVQQMLRGPEGTMHVLTVGGSTSGDLNVTMKTVAVL